MGIYPEKTEIQKDTHTQCSLQPYLQQLEHGSNLNTHRQMMDTEFWYIYEMEYYSANKKEWI